MRYVNSNLSQVLCTLCMVIVGSEKHQVLNIEMKQQLSTLIVLSHLWLLIQDVWTEWWTARLCFGTLSLGIS